MKHVSLTLLFSIMALCISAAAEDVSAMVFGGADTFKVFNTAPKVTASRLAPPLGVTDYKTDDLFDPRKYRVTETVPVPPKVIEQIRSIFADPTIYVLNAAKGCIPQYGIRFTFASDSGTVVLDLCLECSIFAVTHDGKLTESEDFDGGSERLIAISQSLFPKDKELQALPK